MKNENENLRNYYYRKRAILMAGKLPSEKDKGRCLRCPYSCLRIEKAPDFWIQVPKNTKRIRGRRQFLYCSKYNNVCCRVAWNCTEIY